jgi:hypothetical protein
MKRYGIGIVLLLIVVLLSAGCTQSQPSGIRGADTLPASTSAPLPAVTSELVAPATTGGPLETVTVIHYIEPTRVWRDTELHFGLTTPQDWAVTTRQLSTAEGSQGLEYQTDVLPNDLFYIRTYPVSRNQDQEYRDSFRKWVPAPAESTVITNNIVYDRFESTKDGKTRVGYVVRKSSANDIGYASVIAFTADATRPFEKEDFDKIVASFAYFTKDQAPSVTGEEIPRVR